MKKTSRNEKTGNESRMGLVWLYAVGLTVILLQIRTIFG